MFKRILFCMCISCFCLQGVEAKMNTIQLPKPRLMKSIALNETILKRRSVRSFNQHPLTIEQISQLFWAAQSITDETKGYRSAPSAGALYPLELYLVRADGVWHYDVKNHSLNLVSQKNVHHELSKVALNQEAVEQAPIDIVITGIFKRTTKKYGERGIRYVYMEAGHVAQNILLEATGLNLRSVPIGAFHDHEVQSILELPTDHIPLYIIPVGK